MTQIGEPNKITVDRSAGSGREGENAPQTHPEFQAGFILNKSRKMTAEQHERRGAYCFRIDCKKRGKNILQCATVQWAQMQSQNIPSSSSSSPSPSDDAAPISFFYNFVPFWLEIEHSSTPSSFQRILIPFRPIFEWPLSFLDKFQENMSGRSDGDVVIRQKGRLQVRGT